jgi:hypothetical protein
MSDYKTQNRERLVKLLSMATKTINPPGWKHVTTAAIGGLTCIGFSKTTPVLLVCSSSGRGLFECASGAKITRDEEEYAGLDESGLYCSGIGKIENETIHMAGIYGGGLPLTTKRGESIDVASPHWPEQDMFLCLNNKNVLIEGHQSDCYRLLSDDLRAYGFSWCSNFFIAATGSEFYLWKREGL